MHTSNSVFSFYKTDNFRDGLLKVVNLGDDTDTTGAIFGQVMNFTASRGECDQVDLLYMKLPEIRPVR